MSSHSSNDDGKEENVIKDSPTDETGDANPNDTLPPSSANLALDESMSEVALEVTLSGGIVVDDIENNEHHDESNEDEEKDEEEGLVTLVPSVQSEQDSDNSDEKQGNKLVATQNDGTRGATSTEQGDIKHKRWMICMTMSLVVIIIVAVVVPCALLLPRNNNGTESDQQGTSQIDIIMHCLVRHRLTFSPFCSHQRTLYSTITTALDTLGVNTKDFLLKKDISTRHLNGLSAM